MGVSLLLDEQMATTLIVVLTAAVVFLFVLTVYLFASLKRSYGRLTKPWQDSKSSNISTEKVIRLGVDVRELNNRLSTLEAALPRVLCRTSLVRFNAFSDTGSDLSFALALLNDNGDGVVITSLYGRDEGRVYAKPVRQGSSAHPLSAEEKTAISDALRSREL